MIEDLFGSGSTIMAGTSRYNLDTLIRLAKEVGTGRSRFLLHRDHSEMPQVMIIYLERGSEIGLHRHPDNKSELYLVLEGELSVEYMEEGDNNRKVRVLAPWGNTKGYPSLSVHRDSVWHEPKSISDYTLYLEIYSGPFEKSGDVEYLGPKSN
jgi:cupin fold WbuC family metalloprotein